MTKQELQVLKKVVSLLTACYDPANDNKRNRNIGKIIAKAGKLIAKAEEGRE